MTDRRAHLVGSLPGPDARTAMTTALDVLGPYLRSLPDGETGERRDWVESAVDAMASHPDMEPHPSVRTTGRRRLPRVRVRRGHRLYGATMDLGHAGAVRETHPVFRELTQGREDRTGLVFQQGVPGDLDMAFVALGPRAALAHRDAFTEATLGEVCRARAVLGPDALFQVEVPIELVLLAKAPARARAALAAVLARQVVRVPAASPLGTRFAVHLCVGDPGHKALVTPLDAGPLVLLANAIVERWPAGRPLTLVHAPFAAGDRPTPTDRAFLEPLRHLALPPEVAFAAGFAHEDQGLAEQVAIRDRTEEILGREVAVSAACGLGRRTEEAGLAVLRRTAELCTAA